MSQILKPFGKWMKKQAEIFAQVNQYDPTNGDNNIVRVSKGKFRAYLYERRSNELSRGGALKTEQLKATVTAVFIFDPKAIKNAGVTFADSDRIEFEGDDYSVIHANNIGRFDEVFEVFVRKITGG